MTGVIAAYDLLEWVSFIHEYKGVPITPWNPGLGPVFGFMVLCGARYAAALFAGAIIAEIAVLRSNLWWPILVGLAAIIAAGYGLIAKLARSYLQFDVGLNRLGDVVLLLVTGPLALCWWQSSSASCCLQTKSSTSPTFSLQPVHC
jgi:hypothetical protein